MPHASRKLHIRGSFEQLAKGMALVGEGARRAGLGPRRREALQEAAREVYLAAFESAVSTRPHECAVEVDVSWDEEGIVVTLFHAGEGLAQLCSPEARQPRLECIRRAVDEVRCERNERSGSTVSLVMRTRRRPRAA